MLKIFLRTWQVNWAEQWQYRASLLMYLLYGLITPIVFLSVWRTIAASQGQLKGFTVNDFTAYYLTLLLVDNLTSEVVIYIFAYKIRDGSLSSELLKPVHPVLINTLMNNLALKALNFIVLLPIWGLLFVLFQPNFSAVTRTNLLLGAAAIALGFTINFLLGSIISCVAFWTTRVYSLHEFVYAFVMLLGGLFVPIDLLPGAIRLAATILPFQLFYYFPIQLILGKLSAYQIQQNFFLDIFWLVICGLGFWWLWREGLKRYSAVGA